MAFTRQDCNNQEDWSERDSKASDGLDAVLRGVREGADEQHRHRRRLPQEKPPHHEGITRGFLVSNYETCRLLVCAEGTCLTVHVSCCLIHIL